MLRLLAIPLVLAATGVAAQGPAGSRNGWELGLRYWYSSGIARWSHNAQSIDPSAGNPTSILTYDEVNAHAIELHARKNFRHRWFVRGNAGLGGIRRGSFDDEDYAAGQVKFSDSTSPVKGNRLTYASVDLGRDLWVIGEGSTTVGLFAGYHHWSERLDAFGATYSVNFVGAPSIDTSVRVISNEAKWSSLRAGVTFTTRMNPATKLSIDAAWVPYARLRNEDSHFLRSDFGPTPNLFINGRGYGVQLDLELRHAVSDGWELGAGLRHWWLRTSRGDVSTATFSAPLVELQSQRTGVTLSATRRW
jgi:outer membrane protein Pom